MVRPRKDPGDSFSYSEKALAGPIGKSAFQYLHEGGFLTPGSDLEIVKQVGIIGGFMAAGAPLAVAAQATKCLLTFEFENGELPSGLREVAEKEATAEELSALPAVPNDHDYHQLIIRAEERWLRDATASAKKVPVESIPPFDYWTHVSQQRQYKYYAGLVPALPSDVRIEICDRRHAFLWPTSRLKKFGADQEWEARKRAAPPDRRLPEQPGYVGRFEGWERGSETRFVHVSELIQMNFDNTSNVNAWRGQAARLQAEAEQDVLPNAVGKLTVNLSLAVRRALDRIAARRAGVSLEAMPNDQNQPTDRLRGRSHARTKSARR